MATPSVGAAAAVAACFLVLLCGCIASFRLTKFRVYLLLGVSCAFRGIGYALRASNLSSFSDAKAGSYLALANAGYGISLAVICLMLGCWWKNSDAGAGQRWLSIGSRLLIAPVIVFGPLCGVVLAGLIYGSGTPAVLKDATQLRKAVTWGMLIVLIMLLLDSLLAAMLAWRGQRAQQQSQRVEGLPASRDPDCMVLVVVACCGLLIIAASVRVATNYHRTIPDRDVLFYVLQILPELLEVTLLLWPKLMPRASLGRRFPQWWQEAHGQAAATAEGAVKGQGDAESGSRQVGSNGHAAEKGEQPPLPWAL